MRNIYQTIMKPENKEFIKSLFSIDYISGTLEIDIDKYHNEIDKYPGLELPLVAVNAGKLIDEKGYSLSARGTISASVFFEYLSSIKLFNETGFATMDNVMTALINNTKIPIALLSVTHQGDILHNPKTGDLCKIVPIKPTIDTVNNNLAILIYLSMSNILPENPYKNELSTKMRTSVFSNPNDFVESVFWYNIHTIDIQDSDELDHILTTSEFEGWKTISFQDYTSEYKNPTFVQQLILQEIGQLKK